MEVFPIYVIQAMFNVHVLMTTANKGH